MIRTTNLAAFRERIEEDFDNIVNYDNYERSAEVKIDINAVDEKENDIKLEPKLSDDNFIYTSDCFDTWTGTNEFQVNIFEDDFAAIVDKFKDSKILKEASRILISAHYKQESEACDAEVDDVYVEYTSFDDLLTDIDHLD